MWRGNQATELQSRIQTQAVERGLGDADESATDRIGRGRFEILEHETALEPATPTLAKGQKGQR